MNFKEAYKNANNSIKADRALIDTIYEKAEKNKKAKVINYPVFGSFAAAAAVFLIVFNTVNFNTGKVKGIDTKIATNDIMQAGQSDNLNNAKTALPQEDYKTGESYTYTQSDVNNKDKTTNTNTEETAVPETDITITDSTTQTENAETEFAPDMARAALGGGGGASQANAGITTASLDTAEANDGLNFEFYTPDKYYDYIGINPMAIAKIPSDMVFNEFIGADIITDEKGNITYDTAIFTAYNNTMEKNITIEITKLATDIQKPLFVDDDNYKSTSFTASGCNFSVTAFNITAEEFDTLIASLKQK